MTKKEQKEWLQIMKDDILAGGIRTTVKEAKRMARLRIEMHGHTPVEYPILCGGCLVCERTKKGIRYTRVYENNTRNTR